MVSARSKALRLVVLGPPGAGKGTQSRRLAQHFGLPHIDTGALLREQIAIDTPLGRQAVEGIRRGELAPDEQVIRLIRRRLGQPDARTGFVLDGFPRSPGQAQEFEEMLARSRRRLTSVLVLDVPEEEARVRLLNRVVCPDCGSVYNLRSKPPEVGGICPNCLTPIREFDGALACTACTQPIQRRDDDSPEAIEERLQTFRRETLPVIERYRAMGVMREVDGAGTEDEVFERVLDALGRDVVDPFRHRTLPGVGGPLSTQLPT